MESEESMQLEGHLLIRNMKYMFRAENPEYLEKLRDMAHKCIDNIFEWRLEELIGHNARLLDEAGYNGESVIIRKDYEYMDQCASSYFHVPKERAEEISRMMNEEYSHLFYKGEDMEHLMEKELGIKFLKKVWEEDAGPSCSYEPYEKQQAEINTRRTRIKR